MKQEQNKVSNKNVADKVHNIKKNIYIENNENTLLVDIEVENNSWL